MSYIDVDQAKCHLEALIEQVAQVAQEEEIVIKKSDQPIAGGVTSQSITQPEVFYEKFEVIVRKQQGKVMCNAKRCHDCVGCLPIVSPFYAAYESARRI